MNSLLINVNDNSERQIILGDSEEDQSIFDLLKKSSSLSVIKEFIGSLHYYVFEQYGIHNSSKISLFDVYKNKNGTTIIKTNNYAGFIGVKNTELHITLNIHSRFDKSEWTNENQNHSKDYFLYYMLLKSQGINLSNLPPKCDLTTDSHLFLLIILFHELLIKAFSKGLFRKYVTKYTNDNTIRGRINIKRHIRLNMCPPLPNIACDSRQLSLDNNVLQLIRHALEKIDRDSLGHYLLTSNSEIRNCVEELKSCTPSYNQKDRRRVIVSNLKTVIHPLYNEYSELQRISMAILRDEDITYSENSSSCPYGIFFDIAELWENYIASLIFHLGYSHHTRYGNNNKKLFKDFNCPVIIPDYVKEGKINYIADAKYIPLNKYISKMGNGNNNEDKDIGLFYKTITYMHSYSCKKGFLFYPVNDEENILDLEINNDTKDIIRVLGMIVPLSKDFSNFNDYIEKISANEVRFIESISSFENTYF